MKNRNIYKIQKAEETENNKNEHLTEGRHMTRKTEKNKNKKVEISSNVSAININ